MPLPSYKSDFYCECGCRVYARYATREEQVESDKEFSASTFPSRAAERARIHVDCRNKLEGYEWIAFKKYWGYLVQRPGWETL